MLLTLDVGNTNTNVGLWKGDDLIADWRLVTRKETTADELGLSVGGLLHQKSFGYKSIEGMIVASVVPPLRSSIEHFAARYLAVKPIFVEAPTQNLMPVKYTNPKEVGADRIVVSIAAYRRFKTSVIVIDFGTATTFDCVTADGVYQGGAIAPGLRLSADALFQRASRLPKMELFVKPEKAIARDTVASLNVGLVYGYIGLVDGLVARLKREMDGPVKVVATGGLATLIASESEHITEVLPDLTLEGLKIIYYENKWTAA